MKQIYLAYEYLKHLVFSKSLKTIDRINLDPKVKLAFQDDRASYALLAYFDVMENLLADKTEIIVNDMGAGSSRMGDVRKIRDIAKYAVLNEFEAAFISRLLYFLQPKNILQLGTSIGVSALCMGLTCPESDIYTVDACHETHAVASEILNAYAVDNVSLHTMLFTEFLKSNDKKWNFVLLDGDHRYKQSLELLALIKPQLSSDAVILFDDIHWSSGMSKAWREIVKSNRFLCLDFYYFGLLLPGDGSCRYRF